MQRLTGLMIVIAATTGCELASNAVPGSGTAATETREVEAFDKIALSGRGTLNVQCGRAPSLALTTDDNLIAQIETKVQNGRLTIKGKNIRPTIGPEFDIATESLSTISVAGSGDISVTEFEGDALKLSVSGSGSFKVVGAARSVSIKITGSGDADLTELQADEVSVEIAGSGEARVHANEKLSARIAGSGDIRYTGEPAIERSIVGSGSIQRLE